MGLELFDWYGGGSYEAPAWPPAIDVRYLKTESTIVWAQRSTAAAVGALELRARPGAALVMGRFDPPHLGHAFLLRAARASSHGRLHVRVFVREGDFLPGARRVAALVNLLGRKDAEVREERVDERFPTGAPDAARWADWFEGSGLRGTVQRLVSSDANARSFAEAVGLEFLLVDPSRRAFPVSASAIRADPWGAWEALVPDVRHHFARVVGVIGPEGGGKTTTARALAGHFDTSFGAEYLSLVGNGLGRAITPADVRGDVVQGTRETHVRVRHDARRFGFVDGDALNVKLWFERLFPAEPPLTVDPSTQWSHHYLLFDDHPWTGAAAKDEPVARRQMVEKAVKLLELAGRSFELISGPREQRFERAREAIDRWVASKPSLRP